MDLPSKSQSQFQALNKMKVLNLAPDEKTYNYLIKAAAEAGDIKKAESTFAEASKLFLPNKYFYTTLIKCYTTNSNNGEMAHAIMRQMESKGIIPDLPVYTAVINCYRKDRNLEKCWELHREVTKKDIVPDETYIGSMIKVIYFMRCDVQTHDTEKCIKLYKENFTNRKIQPMIQTKNSYLKALSGRVEYCKEAIDMFFKMYQKGEIITEQTVRWALKAAATGANLRSAVQILKIMKLSNIEPTKPIYNGLLRVYGKVCDLPDLNEDFRQIILMDSFKLLEEVQSKEMIDTIILNNVMHIYAMSDQQEKIDGLILPLYEKFALPYNSYTFQTLMEMQYKKRDFNAALRIWNECKQDIEEKQTKLKALEEGKYQRNHLAHKQQNRQTFKMMHMYLEIGIKMMDMAMVLDALKMFKKLNRLPKNQILKFLGNLPNLPEEIHASLMGFKVRFGKARIRKSNEGNIDDPQNK